MTLSELLSNEELRQHEFPVAREKIFLAHAGDCPLPRRVAEAVAKYAQQCTLGDQETFVYPQIVETGRQLASRLMNSRPEEVAFVGPTSLALSFIAGGLKFKRHDNILVYFDDYPSNVYPWMALANKGVQVRLINVRELGVIRPIDVLGQVDEQTRLVALASCHFVAGYRIDYQAIGKALHDRGILFCLDAIQTLGAFPTTVEHVDFLAADAHKWLLGPCAAGLMYVRQSLQEKLDPHVYGWNNVRCPNYVAQEQIVYRQNAQRFEVGSHNFFGLVGLHAAMELILEIGVENIAAELLRKRAWLVPALEAKGYKVLQANAGTVNASGIVTFHRPGTDLPALHQKLETANIVTSLRADRAGQRYIRLSPHFYNTDAELHRLLELL
ncbi:aminotransferase class V-fold PLP-dependent enzyme [Pedosphaera parvula]|uniref:Aminotransferase class V n=1 Tax=Pedosphaera parvula (strain Ellin514) TaxID=320771 RepID=B9XBW2_PEDPL|nr:aminotransferase class V-fold PLP-dependent enzyme [Pedosphaera parvula]EEF62430.1 aminotransferase class V [Pedosphaera parvula Ellin514]